MAQPNTTPVFFMAFANAQGHSFLHQLKKERKQLRKLLFPLSQAGRIELCQEANADLEDLPELLSDYKDRVCIFHYGGHAGGSQLQLEGQAAHVEGLARMLALQPQLQLVFLNGCSTQRQAAPYLEAGVPAVLATTHSILDSAAVSFAQSFYKALATQHSIYEAFQMASGALLAGSPALKTNGEEMLIAHRDVMIPIAKTAAPAPWRLYVQKGREDALAWRIPNAPAPERKGPINVSNSHLQSGGDIIIGGSKTEGG